MTVEIRLGLSDDRPACARIARELTDYFSESGLSDMARDLQHHDLWVAEKDRTVVGFCTIWRKNDYIAEISWLAVERLWQHQGIGSRLLEAISSILSQQGVELLEVKTLAASADYPPYEAIQRFYENQGFRLADVIDPYPYWEPGNPCAIYFKTLKKDARASGRLDAIDDGHRRRWLD